MIVLDSADTVADKQVCFANDYGDGDTSGGSFWGAGVDDNATATDSNFVIAYDANSQASMGGDDDILRLRTNGSAVLSGDFKASSIHTHSDTASASGTATVTVGDGGMGIWAAQFGNGNDAEYKCGFWWSMNGNSSVQVHTVDTGANGNSANCDITMSAGNTTISAAFGSKSGGTGALKIMSLGFN
tara:strand:- start:42 stop:599 length:558 start_codon:yes stop_codon:yes gene_type:complete